MHEDLLLLFGKRVIETRKTRGWSQEKLALESGIARSYLGGVERGERNVTLRTIQKLAQTLDVQMTFLVDLYG